MQYEVVILHSCAVQILYNNDDDGSTLILKWIYGMALRCVGPGQTVGTSVCVCDWIWRFYWWSMQYDVVISPSPSSCAVQIHCNGDDGSALILNECMERHCVALTLQVVRLCVCALEFEGFIGVRCSMMSYALMRYFICCANTLQWRWRLCIDFKWMYGTVLCWSWPNSTYVCIATCVHGCYWCSINVVRGRNLTLMCCPNTLQ